MYTTTLTRSTFSNQSSADCTYFYEKYYCLFNKLYLLVHINLLRPITANLEKQAPWSNRHNSKSFPVVGILYTVHFPNYTTRLCSIILDIVTFLLADRQDNQFSRIMKVNVVRYTFHESVHFHWYTFHVKLSSLRSALCGVQRETNLGACLATLYVPTSIPSQL